MVGELDLSPARGHQGVGGPARGAGAVDAELLAPAASSDAVRDALLVEGLLDVGSADAAGGNVERHFWLGWGVLLGRS